jgi:hypothetical protein
MAGEDGEARLGQPAVTRVLRLVRAVATQSDRYSHAIRERLGMHSTDLTAMGIISDAARDGAELTPSQLAAELHLSASAVTSLVSRLEHIGHVTAAPARRRRAQGGRRDHPERRRSGVDVVPAVVRGDPGGVGVALGRRVGARGATCCPTSCGR